MIKVNTRPRLTKGFTLIEIMFVILVLSFVVVQIARTQQTRAQQQAVEHAANDMLNWEVALVNYYLANGQWPDSLSTLVPTSPTGTQPAYMPHSALNAPFVLRTFQHASYEGSTNGNYFILSVETDSYNMAKLLASKLPNAYLKVGSNNAPPIYVYMAIPAPSQTQQPHIRSWIVSAGVISTTNGPGNWPTHSSDGGTSPNQGKSGSAVYLPNCPAGFEGHIILSPLEYQTNDYNFGMHITMPAISNTDTTDISTSENSGYPVVQTDSNGHHYIVLADYPDLKTDSDTSTQIRHLATFMTFCLAQTPLSSNHYPSRWYTAGLEPSTDSSGNAIPGAPFDSDGECSSSWLVYLEQKAGYGTQGMTNFPNCNAVYPLGNQQINVVGNSGNPVGNTTGY